VLHHFITVSYTSLVQLVFPYRRKSLIENDKNYSTIIIIMIIVYVFSVRQL
jgi:hypothetical protein